MKKKDVLVGGIDRGDDGGVVVRAAGAAERIRRRAQITRHRRAYYVCK